MARSTLTYALLLLLLTPMTALAAPPTPTQSPFETFGQWTVQRIDGVNLATVGNESGNALMLRCDTTGCAYLFLSPIIPCTPGVRSNMLFTSSANVGNLSLQAACADKANGFYRSVLTPYADLTAILDQLLRTTRDQSVGLAFALEGGQFYVARFSLAGMQPAMTRLQALNEQAGFTQSRGTTSKDQIL